MNIALVSSQGGHSGQAKLIFTEEVLRNHNAIFITEKKDNKITWTDKSFLGKFKTYFFRKDYLSIYPWRYISAISSLIKVFRKEKTNVIITNGAQLSLPAVIAGRILGIKTIFIDTVIRVKTPNWSARFSYPFSDIFLVQHASMAKKYGKRAKYAGGII